MRKVYTAGHILYPKGVRTCIQQTTYSKGVGKCIQQVIYVLYSRGVEKGINKVMYILWRCREFYTAGHIL